MRMYFAEYVQEEELCSLVQEQILNKKIQIKQLESERSKWEDNWTPYQKLTYDIGLEQYQGEVTILENFLKESYK